MLTVAECIIDALHKVTRENNVGIGEVTLNMTGDVILRRRCADGRVHSISLNGKACSEVLLIHKSL